MISVKNPGISSQSLEFLWQRLQCSSVQGGKPIVTANYISLDDGSSGRGWTCPCWSHAHVMMLLWRAQALLKLLGTLLLALQGALVVSLQVNFWADEGFFFSKRYWKRPYSALKNKTKVCFKGFFIIETLKWENFLRSWTELFSCCKSLQLFILCLSTSLNF